MLPLASEWQCDGGADILKGSNPGYEPKENRIPRIFLVWGTETSTL